MINEFTIREVMTSAKSFITVFVICVCSLTTNLSAQMQWTPVTTSAEWQIRFQHSAVVFNNKMWVMGGTNDTIALNDVWSSSDGVVWNQEASSSAWTARKSFSVLDYKNRMWIVGGDTTAYKFGTNDVWYSK